MSVEFIGMIGTQAASEIHPPRGPAIDIDYVRRFAQAHEQAGFDRILIGYFSNAADGFIVAQYAAFVTERLGLMLAHRPGFVAPTLAARKLATLDHFSGGRLALHVISGGDDDDQAKALRHVGGILRDQEPVGGVREISDQDAIEIRLLMGLRETADIIDVEGGALGRMNLGPDLRADHADKFDAHGRSPLFSTRATTGA